MPKPIAAFTALLHKITLSAACVAATTAAHAALPIAHWQQPDGARVWFVRSQALPMVDVHIEFDAGARLEPRTHAGIAAALALMASKGIATAEKPLPNQDTKTIGAMDENALAAAWADVGASFFAQASADGLSWSLRTLTRPDLLERSLALAAAQLARPALDAQIWQRERERSIAALAEADTRPATRAQRAFAQAVYGPHPYGQRITAATLAAIDRAALQQWHAQLVPCRAKISIVGDIAQHQAAHIATQLMAHLNNHAADNAPHSAPQPAGLLRPTSSKVDLGRGCPPSAPIAEVAALEKAVDIRLPFAGTHQAHILVGQPGIARNNPDYFAVLLGNHILGGGGFSARLMEEIREKRGLTYGVGSSINPGRHAGAFTIQMQTKAEKATEALSVTRAVLADFLKNGPTEKEVQEAKSNLIAGFALRLDSNAKVLANVANIARHDLPLDYLDTWPEKIQALSRDDIHAAMQRHLNADKMVTVVLGEKAAEN